MSERYRAGDRVRVQTTDPPGHTRVPRYVRGAIGTIVEVQGVYPLADDRARGHADVPLQPVYTVRFAAHELWGAGDHAVTVDLWESYLISLGEEGAKRDRRSS